MGDETEEAGEGAGTQINTGEYVISSGGGIVNYHFPVTIEVRTETAAIDTDALVELALARLAEGLESA